MGIPQNAQLIWQALTSQGVPPIQAAGIEGNAQQESGGNPELHVIDSNGAYSWGLWMFNDLGAGAGHPYTQYITGNLQQDIPNQTGLMLSEGGLAAAAGATPQQAAANFMNTFERPAAATSGVDNRMQSAADVYQAAVTNQWPTGGAPGAYNYQPSTNPDGTTSAAGAVTTSYNPFIANPLSDVQQIWADIGGGASGIEKSYQSAARFVSAVIAPSTWLRFSEVIFGAVLLSGGIAMFAMVLASSAPGANLVTELAALIPGEGQAARIGTSAARGTASFARASGRRAPRVAAPRAAPRPSRSSSSSHAGRPHRARTHAGPRVGAAERQVTRTFRDATGDSDDARYDAAKRARRENKQVHKHFMDTSDIKRRTP